MLGHLLHLHGIEAVVLEARSREYVEQRVRAGVLEQGTVDLLTETGVADRLRRRGAARTTASSCASTGRRHRIPLTELTGGRSITIYGQQEVVKDLIAARLDAGAPTLLRRRGRRARTTSTPTQPRITYEHEGEQRELRCDFVAGCDGFHGVCRESVPERRAARASTASIPFGWLGILAEAAPSTRRAVYACHEHGFALYSMRSPDVTRLYLQVARPTRRSTTWSDERIWEELDPRLQSDDGWSPNEGPILEKGSRRCAASWPSRCVTAGCSSPATPRTSSRRPARRG